MDDAVLAGDSLVHDYGHRRRRSANTGTRAVDGVSIEVREGETLAIVGESGCGKSTLSRLMLGLMTPTSGAVLYRGQRIDGLKGHAFETFRRDVQVVFQDPSASLNPRKRVWQIIASAMRAHGLVTRQNAVRKAIEQLELVGLNPADTFAHRYPHQLSGGQQQRVALARAVSVRPRIIVADEPLSSLDLSIQAQVLELMSRLQRETGVGYLLITHDLNVVTTIAHRVAVMYLGRVVEAGPSRAVFDDPRHPYTRALLDARLVPDPQRRHTPEAPSTIAQETALDAVPGGCRFHVRCTYAQDDCLKREPDLRPDLRPDSSAACYFSAALPRYGDGDGKSLGSSGSSVLPRVDEHADQIV